MVRVNSAALLVLTVVLTGCAVVLTSDVHRLLGHVDGTSTLLIQRWTPAKGKPDAVIDALYNFLHATNDNVNRPCGGGKPCGTLAALDKTATKIGDSVVTTQLAERTTVPHVLAAMDAFKDAGDELGGTADQATTDLETANTAIAGLEPLEKKAGVAFERFNALMMSGSLDSAIGNVNRLAANSADLVFNANGIVLDGKKVADKVTADYLKPVPWYMQPIKKSSDLLDIGAALARHTP